MINQVSSEPLICHPISAAWLMLKANSALDANPLELLEDDADAGCCNFGVPTISFQSQNAWGICTKKTTNTLDHNPKGDGSPKIPSVYRWMNIDSDL